jgi:hypothetical protein
LEFLHFEESSRLHSLFNNIYDSNLYNPRNKYSNTKFDLINNPGGWVDKWKNIPKICKIKQDVNEITNKIGLFYWNDDAASTPPVA